MTAVDQQRLARIIEARRRGDSLQAIGDVEGITRERVRQLIQRHALGIVPADDSPLRTLMAEAGLTQTALAELCGVHRDTIWHAVNGEYRPRRDTAEAICAALTLKLGREVTAAEVFPAAADVLPTDAEGVE